MVALLQQLTVLGSVANDWRQWVPQGQTGNSQASLSISCRSV